jgi:serine O-acetyltransferase
MDKRAYFKSDLGRLWAIRIYDNRKPMGKRIMLFLQDRGIHFVLAYRIYNWTCRLYRLSRPIGIIPRLFASILLRTLESVDRICIDDGNEIGPGLFIAHPSMIFIDCAIGSNCFIHQCTSIGYGYSDGGTGRPRIGDNVWIGPNVVISGNISIGSNSTIAAGAVITRDVPDNSLAMGNPARIVLRNFDNSILHGFA